MGKPHKHAEVIKAWADGEIIQCKAKSETEWETYKPLEPLAWVENLEYRIKPEPEYPKSSMTADECAATYVSTPGGFAAGMKAVADAAVARHCQEQEKENV